MPAVITDASTVSCDHPPTPPGGGAVALASAARGVLTVEGQAVLGGTLANAPIDSGGCGLASAGSTPCTLVTAQNPGSTSRVLKLGGAPVLLATASGPATGSAGATWSVKDAGQTILRAA
jgi:hypothetical protein